ncbi:MBG domain-containing protein [Spongisporangium articulatum]|uniref:MBG domain-containing protein n=1 Tax=Spongisporangium articulatum TaxID=3362603 RepID=A0ABW8AIJ0_9ACTN
MPSRPLRPVRLAVLAGLVAGLVVGTAATAHAVLTLDPTGATLGPALAGPGTVVTSSTLLTRPAAGNADAASTTPLAGFPSDGPSYALLSTGSALNVPNVNADPGPGTLYSSTPVAGRGDKAFDVSVLRADVTVPAGANCLAFDFTFLSGEYPDFVGQAYNDGFVAELDRTTWTTSGTTIAAPDNFAFDASGHVVSVNALGVGGMSAANAAGTMYRGHGATGLLRATTPVTPGQHSVYFSIFDNGDGQYDSTALVDNLRTGYVADAAANCRAGARVAGATLDLVSSPTAPVKVGRPATAQFRLTDAKTHAPVAGAPVSATVTGVNPQTTTVTTDPAGLATVNLSGTAGGADQVSACYRPAEGDACVAFASAGVNWLKDVTVAATSYTVSFGAEQPAPRWTVAGLDGDDGLTAAPTCTVPTPHTAVGSYPITCAGAAADPKYVLNYAPGTLTVTQAPVTVQADSQTVTYGEDDPAFTFTTTGLRAADHLLQAPVCGVAGEHSAAGTYPITCTGADAGGNYQIAYAAGTLTVRRAVAVVSADNRSVTYGDDDPAFAGTVTGLLGQDRPVQEPTCGVSAAHAHAGSYAITCTGADLGPDYAVSYVPGTLTVKPSAVVVAAANQTVTLGAELPGFTYSTSGLVRGDTLTAEPVCAVAGPHDGVGEYPIVCTGAEAGPDYTVTSVPGTLTVTAAHATVTADNQTITYGDPDPEFTYTTGGTLADGTTGGPVTCGVAGPHTDAGDYPITCTGPTDDGNGDIAYVAGTLTVNRAAATLTADNRATTYGDADPVFTYGVSGLQPGDALVTAPTCAVAGAHADAGTYPVTCAGADAGGNYTLTTVAGRLTVKPAPLTVTADNKAAVFGLGLPSLTYSVSGLVGDDQLLQAPTCSVAGGLLAGLHAVTCSGADAGPNYVVKYVGGTLSVDKATTSVYMTPLVFGFLHPTATLTRTDTGAGIAGQTVTFTVGGSRVCSAVTNSRGVATCARTYLFTLSKATATFAGTDDYTASKDDAGLLFS